MLFLTVGHFCRKKHFKRPKNVKTTSCVAGRGASLHFGVRIAWVQNNVPHLKKWRRMSLKLNNERFWNTSLNVSMNSQLTYRVTQHNLDLVWWWHFYDPFFLLYVFVTFRTLDVKLVKLSALSFLFVTPRESWAKEFLKSSFPDLPVDVLSLPGLPLQRGLFQFWNGTRHTILGFGYRLYMKIGKKYKWEFYR